MAQQNRNWLLVVLLALCAGVSLTVTLALTRDPSLQEEHLRKLSSEQLASRASSASADPLVVLVAADVLYHGGEGERAQVLAMKLVDIPLNGAGSAQTAHRLAALTAHLCALYGEDADALRLITRLGANEKSADVIAARAAIAAKQGDFPSSAELYRRALDLRKTDPALACETARAQAVSGLLQDAIQTLTVQLGLTPRDAALHLAAADLYSRSKRFEDAAAEVQTCIKDVGDTRGSSCLRAICLAFGVKREMATMALDLLPTNGPAPSAEVDSLVWLASLQQVSGKPSDAKATLEGCTTRDPKAVQGWQALESVCRALKDTDGASEARRKVTLLTRRNPSVDDLYKATQDHPDDARAFVKLYAGLKQLHRDAEALKAIEQAAKLEPDNKAIERMLKRARSQDADSAPGDNGAETKPTTDTSNTDQQ